jgi:cystathionine beta-synthase
MKTQVKIEPSNSLINQIGNTPLFEINSLFPKNQAKIFAKAEMLNPGGSIKDRLAKSLIESAEADGRLKPGGTVIEVTSGNTGIAVSWICAAKGYKSVIVMSDKNSKEKQDMMKSFGAELIITPHTAMPDDPESNYKTAERLAETTPDSIYLDQYNNPANISCHFDSTGPELWRQTNCEIDCLIAGAGTGGTISGVGRYLKSKNPNVKTIAVDSAGSIFKTYFETGELIKATHYEVEGIGSDKLVGAIDFNVIDRFIAVSDNEAFNTTREIANFEGMFCGGSSGAVIAAARQVCSENNNFKRIVCIFADSGNRYLSKVYNDNWMKAMGYLN